MGSLFSKEEKRTTNLQRSSSASTARSSAPGYDPSYAWSVRLDPGYSASSSSRYDSSYGTTPRPATATSTGYSYTSQNTTTGRSTATTTTAPSRPTTTYSDSYGTQRQTTTSSTNGYPYEHTARDTVATTTRNWTASDGRLTSASRPTSQTPNTLTRTILPVPRRERVSATTQSPFTRPNYIPESADGPTGGPPRSHSFFKVRSQKEIDAVDNLAKQLSSSVKIDDNRPGTKAVIVGKPNEQCCIVQSLPEAGESQWLIIDAFSMNLSNFGEPFPGIQTIIKIFKMEPYIVPTSNRLFQFKLRVLEYAILERPPTPEGLEVVAVANFDVGVVTVVGHSFWEPTIVQWDNDKAVDKCDFVIGEVNRLKDFHEPQMVNGIVCYIKNLREEREYKEKVAKAKNNKGVFAAPLAPKKRAFLTGIRPLTFKENARIKTYCRDVDGLQLDWARLYIRDVCIATSRLEGHIKKQLCEEHTIIVDGETELDRSGAQARLSLTVQLTAVDVKKCLKSQSQETWRVGGDLSIKHPELERFIDKKDKMVEKKYEGGMTVDQIKYEGDRAVVRLRPHPRSYDLFDLIAKTKLKLTGKFTVGPMDDGTDTIASNLFLHFDRFFANKPLFDAWRGKGTQVYSAIPDKNKGFALKEGKSLDESQTLAMRTVMARDKYVCIEAPPGSGKTLLISAIVAASHQAGDDGAMCVSATTNNAISNAIDIVHDLFPEIKVVREYSRTTEGEISQKSKKISLKEMALKAGEFVDLSKEPQMASAIEGYYTCKAELAKFDVGVVTVVGHSFWEPTIVQWDNDKAVDKCDFVIGEVNRLKDFHEPQMVNGIVCYIKNLREEREYKEKVAKAKNNKGVFAAPLAPKKRAFLTGIRPLTFKENARIKTYCRDVDGLQLDWARLYIRDVCIATSRLEGHIKKQLCEEHTIIVDGETELDRSGAQARLSLTVQLTAVDVKKCLKSQSQETWRVGGDLSIKHPELERFIDKKDKMVEKKYEGGMTVDQIKYEGDRAVVRLRPHPRSYDLFDLIAKTKLKLTGKFTVGPMDDGTDTIASNLFLHFDRFFANKPLFDAWRGKGTQVYSAIPDKNKGFALKEGKSLDESQTLAMRTVMARDKYVCIEAPPGSGKTLLISAIVAASHQAGDDGAMCVSATTNNAISNAIDIVHDLFPEIKVVREYSRTTEGEISQKSKKISLKEMALKAGEFVDLSKEPQMASAIEGYYTCKAELAKVRDMTSGLQKLDDLNQAYGDLRKAFLTTYRPYLMGSTCELIARRGDPNAEKALNCSKDDEKLKKKKYDAASITHLILDEASQLPPHLALAVYVSLPALKKITLIGDSAQLGPYTPLEEKTRAYEMVKFGELERLGDMVTTTKVHLWTVYRSHPRIVDLLLKPIYGQELIAGLHHKHRAIATEKSLPAAQDHHDSPVLFVNVENAKCERGVNEKEMEVVLVFIEELRKKKLTGEDVAIVCNHRAQRERITDRLKGKGDIGILNTSVAIHTVDSFQGKEAKIVLVLTTKACSNPKQAQRVFEFVANPNRGTVAVSRAQHAVYLFGDWKMLVRTVFWAKFVPGIMESKCMVDSVWKPSSDTDYRKLSDAAATAKGIGIGGQFPHQGRRPDRGSNKENRGNYRKNNKGNGNGFSKNNGNGGGDAGRGRGAARGGGRGRGGNRRGNNQNTPIPNLLSL